jgi:hypothetical protein
VNEIIINRLFDAEEFQVVPLRRKREWMDSTPDAYAYQCMPLAIANEYGWAVLSPAGFTATWEGSRDVNSIDVVYDEADIAYNFADSQFGSGILTVSPDFIVKTPENVSLYIRGIPNKGIQGLQSLDAIVETDWLPFTFTYNYRFLQPGTIRVEKDQPLFCFFPINRGEVEDYTLVSKSVSDNEEFLQKYHEYRDSRQGYLDKLDQYNSGELSDMADNSQRYYSNAKDPHGNKYSVTNHTKKVKLNPVNKAVE